MNHCEYCGTAHSGLLSKRGDLTEDEALHVYRNWRDVELPRTIEQCWSSRRSWATFTAATVTAADVDVLRGHGFSDVNVFDIVVLTASRNFMNRVNDGLGVTTERLRRTRRSARRRDRPRLIRRAPSVTRQVKID